MFRLLAAVFFCVSVAETKIFDRCELANLFKKAGITEDNLHKWVCIGQHNGLDTSRNYQSPDGAIRSYGIFKISDEYWCDRTGSGTGKLCGIPCRKLMDDDIRDDIRCAMKIYNHHGFNAWIPWMPECMDVNKNYLKKCSNLGNRNNVVAADVLLDDDDDRPGDTSIENTGDDLDFWNNSGFLGRRGPFEHFE